MSSMRNQPCPCGSGKKYKKCCGAAGAQQPRFVKPVAMGLDALFAIASQLMEQGRMQEAAQHLQSILQTHPGNDRALIMLAGIAHAAGQIPDAIDLTQQAIAVKPTVVNYHNNLGGLFKLTGQFHNAADCFLRATKIEPGNVQTLLQLGECYGSAGAREEAIAQYNKAAMLAPGMAEIPIAIGVLHAEMGNMQAAADSFRKSYVIGRRRGETDVVPTGGMYDMAIAACEKALSENSRIDPVLLQSDIAYWYLETGEVAKGIAVLRQALQRAPQRDDLYGALLLALNYTADLSPEAVFEEHKGFDSAYATQYGRNRAPHINPGNPEKKLRIGYVSSNFYEHSVANFIKPVLAHHDASQFEIIGYHNNKHSDGETHRLQAMCSHWLDIHAMSDDEFVRVIKDDAIDILIDLNGHTADNRLLAFARKPAPIQCTWLGYPNTTGLSAMDYRITDASADPEGTAEPLYTERIIRLPDTFSCYTPPDPAPQDVPPPVLDTGHITFGSFNNFSKTTPKVLEVWRKLLAATPGSHLLLKARLFNDEAMQTKLETYFSEAGIECNRLEFIAITDSRYEHLQQYARVDIALDTFPYNGTTTTCEALWMGVPVVTLAGDLHAGRVGVSQMRGIGLPDLIAATPEQYIEICTELAADPEKLQTLRATMRERMRESPLMDAGTFTRNLESAYRDMWRQWCKEGE